MIIDSHCHIYDEKLNEIRLDILNNLKKENQLAVCCADNLLNSQKCVKLANENKNIFAGIGVHPECVESFNKETILELTKLAKNKKVVAIGEIGLDYHYDGEIKNKHINNLVVAEQEIQKNHTKQKEVLIKQINLAQQLNLPCIFHVRDCTGDFIDVLNTLKKEFEALNNNKKFSIKGVVHSFSGSLEVAQIYLNFGLYLGVNGVVTFKNAKNLKEVVSVLPLDKMLIETDCPYLTPEPFRGTLNRPEYVKYVAEEISILKQIATKEVVEQTTQNAINLFKLQI